MESKKQVKLNDSIVSSKSTDIPHRIRESESRNWITTLNNPEHGAKYQFDLCTQDPRIIYAKGQEEKGVEGTHHLQVYTNWTKSIRLSTIRKLWPNGHHEICKNPKASILYCGKSDTRVDGPWVHGVDPITRHPNGKKSVKELITYTEDQLQELGANAYVASKKAISIVPGQGYLPSSLRGIWIWGAPGTGKSRYAYDKYPGAFRKAQNKWWDGYCREKVVILDDLDKLGGQTLGHYLKIWGDRYPCTGEVKGFTIQLQHDIICLTTNYTIEQMWPDDLEMQQAIRRRFKVIRMVVPGKTGPHKISASGDIEVSYEQLTTLDEPAQLELAGRVQRQHECMQFLGNLDDSGLGDDGVGIIQDSDVLLKADQSDEELDAFIAAQVEDYYADNHKSSGCIYFDE